MFASVAILVELASASVAVVVVMVVAVVVIVVAVATVVTGVECIMTWNVEKKIILVQKSFISFCPKISNSVNLNSLLQLL